MGALPARAWIEIGVAAALVGAGVTALTHAPDHERNEAKAALNSAHRELAPGRAIRTPDELEKVRQRTEQCRTRLREASALERDVSALYARVGELAGRCGVRVDQVAPVTSAPAALALPPEDPGVNDRRSAYTLSVMGRYADVARFVRGIEEEAGFTVVRSMRVTPGDSESAGQVRAVLVTEHFFVNVAHAGAGEGRTP